ncbi:hypothetical protein COT97_02280 [Candidatus Falkowbacteria bacterium CG10_big_fil_rev_8_21_14_0_10_39_11]|uniref:Segregation and condensation protein A n=1 Tax=Candidatus Falkowbacteria bacterium CG10_big_fil_rev_8_21_14_0_10_39_11 TaxID=1974565 RepID=A0A2H0V5D8_9BACT|nr:MAG: hypothetical protein COT97_02280 [Candidatus Falkowbacteria bacterium CG10_big_fil_rev_8_21_14_0_10_39_11]
MYKIKIEKFAGPLDLLLQLIEQEKLEVTEIALSQVTDQYIEYIEKLENRDPEELSDFLVIAARLLYLKSKAILPIISEEEDFDDLEKQLKIYKEFLDATKKVEEMLKLQNFTYSRERQKIDLVVEFSPAENIKKDNLKEIFLSVLKRLDPLVKMPRKMIERSVSLRQKILHLKELLSTRKKMSFKELFDQAESRTEVIMSFLAMLELVKQKHLTVKQGNLFEDIHIEKI